MKRPHACLAACLLVAAAPASRAEEPPAGVVEAPAGDLESERRWLLSLDRDFGESASRGNPGRLRSLIADDGIFLGRTVRRGSAEFAAEWSSLFNPRADARLAWRPLEAEVSESLDLAYSLGEVRVEWVRGREREAFERSGHYLSIWRKNAQGAWKIRASGTLAASPEGPYGYGRERLRGLAEVWPPLRRLDVGVDLSWEPEIVTEAAAGDLAFSFGRYTLTTRADDASESGSGGYLTLWRRDSEGVWAVAAEAFSPPL